MVLARPVPHLLAWIGTGIWPMLHPATRGPPRCCSFILELSCALSSHIVSEPQGCQHLQPKNVSVTMTCHQHDGMKICFGWKWISSHQHQNDVIPMLWVPEAPFVERHLSNCHHIASVCVCVLVCVCACMCDIILMPSCFWPMTYHGCGHVMCSQLTWGYIISESIWYKTV